MTSTSQTLGAFLTAAALAMSAAVATNADSDAPLTPQQRVRQLEEQRLNRTRMSEELNKSLRGATQSLQKAGEEFVDQFLDAVPGGNAAAFNIGRRVSEARQAYEEGDVAKGDRLMLDATTTAVKEAASAAAEAVGATAIGPVSLGVDLGMDVPALAFSARNLWIWVGARREIQRQIDRNDEAIASIDKELPSARGQARGAKADDSSANDDTPSHPPATDRLDWEELDKAIELMRQVDLSPLNGFEQTHVSLDGQTVVDDEATLRTAQEEQQREQEAVEAERRRNLEARDDATKSLGKFKLSIPPGWVPCTCPDKHPGAGIFVNGVQYHTPLLHCDG